MNKEELITDIKILANMISPLVEDKKNHFKKLLSKIQEKGDIYFIRDIYVIQDLANIYCDLNNSFADYLSALAYENVNNVSLLVFGRLSLIPTQTLTMLASVLQKHFGVYVKFATVGEKYDPQDGLFQTFVSEKAPIEEMVVKYIMEPAFYTIEDGKKHLIKQGTLVVSAKKDVEQTLADFKSKADGVGV